jgi:hypothetical protein
MGWNGPWYGFVQPGFWFIVAGAMLNWAWLARLRLLVVAEQIEPFPLRLLEQSVEGEIPDTRKKVA